MSKGPKEIVIELTEILKSGGRLLDDIEARGRRYSRLPVDALHAIMGISSGYLATYGVTFFIEINYLLVGSLSAAILGCGGVLLSRRRRPDRGHHISFETNLDHANQLVEFLRMNGATLPPEQHEQISRQIAWLLSGQPSPPLSIPAPHITTPRIGS